MRLLLLGILLWQASDAAQAPTPDQRYFQYRRSITTSASAEGQACATLDAEVYAKSAASLKDVRLYEGERERPYAITLSESSETDSEPARVSNLGMQGGKIVFDLTMPDRPYTDVVLDLDAKDFLASAEVSGVPTQGKAPVQLGSFTLFDLSAQHLSRNMTLHLQEAKFSVLHIELRMAAAPRETAFVASPSVVVGATIPPSREAQTLYTSVATTTALTQKGSKTVANFRLPAHVPVERVAFGLDPEFRGNFSRDVQIRSNTDNTSAANGEMVSGTIGRVHMNQAGREVRQEQLAVPAILGSNLQAGASVEVEIDNRDDSPLPIRSISLEMRQRRLCFNVPSTSSLELFYGDVVLQAPVYDFARVLSLGGGVSPAQLGPEEKNPMYLPRPLPERPLTERHPELLWIVLLAVVCALAVVATHSAKRMPK